MRSFLIALVLGSFGFVVGYMRSSAATQGTQELFGDPDIFKVAEANKNAPPRVPKVEVVGGAEFDFGTMQRGTKRRHTFVLRNDGEAPLALTNKGSTCKCTIGTLGNSEILPGQETQVELEWRGEGALSTFGQTATIGTNDPTQLEVKLMVRGELTSATSSDPPVIALGDFVTESSQTKEIILFSTFDEPLEINRLTISEPGLDSKIKTSHTIEKIREGKYPNRSDARYLARIKLEIPSGLRGGVINCNLHVESNIEQEDEINIPITGRVMTKISFLAAEGLDEDNSILDFGKVLSGEGKKINLLVSVAVAENENVELTSEVMRLPPDVLNVTIGKPKRGGKRLLFPVTLEIPKGAQAVPQTGTNSQNFAKLVFRSKSENPSEQPLFLRLQVE